MTGKDDSNNPPNVAPWPAMSTVLATPAVPEGPAGPTESAVATWTG